MTRDETIFLSSTWHEMNLMSNCSLGAFVSFFFLQLLKAQTTCIKSLESGLEKGELHHGECKRKWFKESEVASQRVQRKWKGAHIQYL
jgi:hypothetical protein